jgi:hypothetical protein
LTLSSRLKRATDVTPFMMRVQTRSLSRESKNELTAGL